MVWIQVLYWSAVAAILHTYVAYPCFVILLARRRPNANNTPNLSDEDANQLPRVAILISAYNAGKSIRARIENLCQSDYPTDRMTIVVASDGSTDNTVLAAKETLVSNLVVLDFKERQGKASNLIRSIAKMDAEIVVFSDATSYFPPTAIKNLARHFLDESVGIVSGQVRMLTEDGDSAEGVYWRLESKVRQFEAKLGVLTGVSGAIYAIRRSLFVAPNRPTINDDMVFPILVKQSHRCRYVQDNDAIAEVVVAHGIRHEFRRRRRIGLGVFQSLAILLPLLRTMEPFAAFCLLSHKMLRWLGPFALITIFFCSFLLRELFLFQVLICLQLLSLLFALLGLIGASKPSSTPRWNRWCAVATSFYSMNLALLFGFVDWVFASKKVVWEPTPRPEREALLRAGNHARTQTN